MASNTLYFDPTDTACTDLLPPSLRTVAALAQLAAECEADVINYFTKPIARVVYAGWPSPATLPVTLTLTSIYTNIGNGLGVFLAGYTVDPTQCTDPAFILAMRRTVALVFEWRYPQSLRDVQVKQQSAPSGSIASGQRTWINYTSLPPAWTRFLRAYDYRESGWAI